MAPPPLLLPEERALAALFTNVSVPKLSFLAAPTEPFGCGRRKAPPPEAVEAEVPLPTLAVLITLAAPRLRLIAPTEVSLSSPQALAGALAALDQPTPSADVCSS